MKRLFIFLFILFFTTPVYSATKYIDDAGDNGNGGTGCGDAYATFAYAFTQMSGGDTLYVCDGTYN